MPKTAQLIAEKADQTSADKPKRKMHPNSLANLVAPWTAETKPKSPGRPRDTAAEISRKAFENNMEEIYKRVSAELLTGSPYAYAVHSDRAYGKLKETKEVTHVHAETADGDLQQRIDSILRDLGLATEVSSAGRVEGTESRAGKTNGAAKDTEVLS